ncbi:alpha/beta fold hydrolase [Paraburkholderia strydomiana]|uniref:alpha/beta fold hydrolase n=1 Tax=Paraburkholderia strydomiana TaxID=1245417 RepID=UPI00285CB83E|nr:alpha/beta hydrolase [Paraburkholderia strydomiana]MDR7006189.1 pimeloyl-ACP methyl ester carboxylesterase [Paraburkholderia strydomiana]
MNHLLKIIAISSLLAGTFNRPVEAKTVIFPAENTCPVLADRPDRNPTIHEQIAHTARGDIAYYRFGKGSPIVLQTGYRATLSEWNAAFLASLARQHEVIVFDNRGIGRSEPDASASTAKGMADDLDALIGTLKLRDVTVVGWSMGGAVAAQLALDYPANVQRIVLMSAPAPGRLGVPVAPDVMATLSGAPGTTFDDVMKLLFPASAVKAASKCFRQNMFVPADYGNPPVPAAVTAGQSALLAAWEKDNAAADALPKLRIDTLVLSGANDQVLHEQNGEAIAKAIPRAEFLDVKGAGHAMMFQYPNALAAAVNRFIAQSPNSRSMPEAVRRDPLTDVLH